jgi:prepilin-type N-terminal cleavage/methylation domain-containing protein/prepilin-type processing-associated H-X9-DG protein
MQRTSAPSAGFTLIELLVVVSIIAVLAALLLPAIRIVRDAAHGAACASNLRQLGMGFHGYADDNDGRFPPFSNLLFGGLNQFYPNLLDDGGYVEVQQWRSQAYGVAEGGIWHCPALASSLANSSGGYGVLESTVHGSGYQIAMLRSQISRTTTRLLISDAEINQASGPYKGWPSSSCPICSGTWIDRRRAAARHGQGRSSNVCFVDGHVAAVPWNDLLTNLNDIWRHISR